MKGAPPAEKLSAKSGEAIPILSDVIETHRLEVDNGALADELAEWVRQERPGFDHREYGFQEFGELLNYAQDKSVVRIVADEKLGLVVYLGAEFHPRRHRPSRPLRRRSRKKNTSRSRWCPASLRRPERFRCPSLHRSRCVARPRVNRPASGARSAGSGQEAGGGCKS